MENLSTQTLGLENLEGPEHSGDLNTHKTETSEEITKKQAVRHSPIQEFTGGLWTQQNLGLRKNYEVLIR